MTIGDDYINSVLDYMPPTMPMRAQIAAELRSHVAERVAQRVSLDEVLRQLGDPLRLAESYLSAEPLISAPFLQRVRAKIIDVLCVIAVAIPMAWVGSRLVPGDLGFVLFLFAAIAGSSVAFGAYTVMAEHRSSQTIGKRMVGIRAVRETGARMSIGQAIVRQLPLFLQIYWIDVLFVLFTEKSQRAFELLSKTRVVRSG
jgi:uncharacterized RDD family membrane protein YckC